MKTCRHFFQVGHLMMKGPLTARSVEEKRSVRGTTSSYLHCSATYKRRRNRIQLWHVAEDRLDDRVALLTPHLLCFPQQSLQENEEVVRISLHKFLQTPAVYAQAGCSEGHTHTHILAHFSFWALCSWLVVNKLFLHTSSREPPRRWVNDYSSATEVMN